MIGILELVSDSHSSIIVVRAINDLTIIGWDDASITLGWTTPTGGSNPIDHYEVLLNSNYYQVTTDDNEGWVISGLSSSTVYNIVLVTVDIFGNKSLPSNEVSETTDSGIPFPWLSDIKHYWNFNNQVLDSVGSADGTPTRVTYTNGLIANAGVFRENNGGSDVLIPSDVLSSSEFTIFLLIKSEVAHTLEERVIELNDNTGSTFFQIRLNRTVSGRINFQIYDGSTVSVYTDSYDLLEWNVLAITAKNNDEMNAYVNGNNIGSAICGTWSQVGDTFNRVGNVRKGGKYPYRGMINALAITDRKFSDSEVQEASHELLVRKRHLI